MTQLQTTFEQIENAAEKEKQRLKLIADASNNEMQFLEQQISDAAEQKSSWRKNDDKEEEIQQLPGATVEEDNQLKLNLPKGSMFATYLLSRQLTRIS